MKLLAAIALLTALWQSPGVARITWTVPQGLRWACLYRQPTGESAVLIACATKPGAYTLELGSVAPVGGRMRPAAGDVYAVRFSDETIARAQLRSVSYMPVWRMP